MPIRVACQCGQSLNVPDAAAGKAVKCPKCQQAVRVPAAATGTPTAAAKPATAKPGTPKTAANQPKPKSPAPAPQATSAGAPLADLFESAGLKQRAGVFCPSCDEPSAPGTAICVKCGFNFNEGTKISGFQISNQKEFGNIRLNEAAASMKREEEVEKRLLGAGTPWWMMLAILAALVIFVGGLLLKMDAKTSGSISSNPTIARIQNANYLPVLAASAGVGLSMVATFAALAIIISAFGESITQGLLCFFIGPYLLYYMFSRMKSRRLGNTVLIYWVAAIMSSICLAYALPKI